MSKPEIWFADLTHTAQGISANTFPLGVSFVVSYAKQQFGNEFAFKLFKFPDERVQAVRKDPPDIIGLANYTWNHNLNIKMLKLFKKEFVAISQLERLNKEN